MSVDRGPCALQPLFPLVFRSGCVLPAISFFDEYLVPAGIVNSTLPNPDQFRDSALQR